MEMLVIIFIIFLGVVVIGSIMGMMSSGRISRLEAQNRNLNERLSMLERVGVNLAKPSAAIAPSIDAALTLPPLPAAPEIKPPVSEHVPELVLEPMLEPAIVAETSPLRAAAAMMAEEKISTDVKDWAPDWMNPSDTKSPKAPPRNLEEMIGGQWSVWVGGLALLVGAVLLIRFSIEVGFFGPTARILMAATLGVVLLVAGEWLKRSDDKTFTGKLGEAANALQGNASVPGLLSAVGVFTLLGASYAAHELYGLISAFAAFAALGLISVGAMTLSVRQGPLLAAIGLLASLATPLLIQSQTPNFMALVGYLFVVGIAGLAVAYRTNWRWLEVGTVAGWLGWCAMSIKAATSGQMLLWGIFLAISFVVTVWRSETSLENALLENPANENSLEGQLRAITPHPYFAVAFGAVSALLIGIVVSETWAGFSAQSGTSGLPKPTLILSLSAFASLIGAALLFKRQSGHIVTAGFLVLIISFVRLPNWQFTLFAVLIAIAVLLAIREGLRFDASVPRHVDDPENRQKADQNKGVDRGLFWPIFAIGLALSSSLSFGAYSENWTREIYFAVILGYSALFFAAGFYSHKKSRSRLYTASLILGAGLAWVVAWAIQLDGLGFSLALSAGAALMVAALALLLLPGTKIGVLGLVGLVFTHAFFIQFPNASSLSARPIINALWIYLALPTVILGMTGYLLHGAKAETKDHEILNSIIEAAALAGLALFAVFQIRHLSNGGAVYVSKIGFEELGLQVATGLCFTLAGLSKRFSGNQVLSKMGEMISYVTLAIFAFGSLVFFTPLFNRGELIEGNVFFNSLSTGLFVPTALLTLCAWRARGRRADEYVNVLGGLSLIGGVMWITAMVRFLFNGAEISLTRVNFSALELWTISAVWLAIGIALLAIGVWKRERAFRIASGVVIILTVLKAFLIDMSGLEGVLRALSFVALGLVLIVIGRAYQRYWLSEIPESEAVN